jgi:MarR family transcriptional regulator, lower aerobic nicotinate degradation pathway regulator
MTRPAHDDVDHPLAALSLGFDRVTTMRVVHGLEARGLVDRQADPHHERRQRLQLTAGGRHVLAQAIGPAERAQRRLLDPLTADERATMVKLLRKLCAALEPVARTSVVAPETGNGRG